ncbi:hypothetical protein, partial [Ferroplasma sp. Type II]|uniref:hypothetical protein n=1 Tax=Ferroplasma sp. Type II TaxID=261388 RepID=UPI0025C5188F
MTLKSHYKIIISIIIVIILLSSLIIYYYPHNNTVYNNNGESVDVKYFSVGYTFPYSKHNYSLSSHFTSGNRESYLNSTIINPVVLPYNCGSVEFNMNISTHNVNDKYVYVTIIGKHVGFNPFTNQSYCKITSGEQIVKLKNSNRIYECLSSDYVDRNTVGNYYNFTLTVSTGKLHNTFYIHAEKESAIYGSIINNTTGNTVKVNTTLYIENMNNSIINTINVRDGHYYYF